MNSSQEFIIELSFSCGGMMKHIFFIGIVIFLAIILTSCDTKSGTLSTEVELPTDNSLTLYCENAGVYPRKLYFR